MTFFGERGDLFPFLRGVAGTNSHLRRIQNDEKHNEVQPRLQNYMREKPCLGSV